MKLIPDTALTMLMIGQGGAPLQVGPDLFGMVAEGSVNLLIEVRVSVVDKVNVLVAVDRPSAAEVRFLPLLIDEVRHQSFDGGLRGLRSRAVGQVIVLSIEIGIACLHCLVSLHKDMARPSKASKSLVIEI